MGPNAQATMAGKALIRGLERALRDMPEQELRDNLTDIRDRLELALSITDTRQVEALYDDGDNGFAIRIDFPTPTEDETWDLAGHDITAIATGE